MKAIENHIIEDTVKYTGAHDRKSPTRSTIGRASAHALAFFAGAADPEELELLKNRVISRLATAYSLEKMRRALNKLKVANDEPAEHSAESSEESTEQKRADSDKAKRIAVKKEGVEFDNKL